MSRRTLPPIPAFASPTDEIVETVITTIARVGASGRVGVAYAGDAGSALLLELSVRVVGRSRVVALVSTGPDAAPARRCAVAQAANACGVATFDVLEGRVDDVARILELSAVVVPDDTDGAVAAPADPAATAPFLEAGLDRATVARLAHDLDLPEPDLPDATAPVRVDVPPGAGPRAPGRSATEDAVQVEAAESELRRLGLDDLRVHHHGDLARLGSSRSDLLGVTAEPLRGEVVSAVRSAGFRLVALDLGSASDPRDA
ncbi:hypothetical protein [Cellulosimicrobium arenosum]|uniref:Uncharacterized protein n=1 Tax=Cellulosimicrobium arenosum TaxID=2708133 RepID=A0A927J081_9MICO|nr:hypothetical protein [Cellulosimicrobium arenosum]MBD8079387.1 hypothetical protein [Cellulosimicrobium arenosum]